MGKTSHINKLYKELKRRYKKKAASSEYKLSIYDEYDACIAPLLAVFEGDRYLERFLIARYLSIKVAFKDAVYYQLWNLAGSLIERVGDDKFSEILSCSAGITLDDTPLYVLVREWAAQRGEGRDKIRILFEVLECRSPESITNSLLEYAIKCFAYGMISVIMMLNPDLDKRGLVRTALIGRRHGAANFQTIRALIEGGAYVTGCYALAKDEIIADDYVIEYLRSETCAKELERYNTKSSVLNSEGYSELHMAILNRNIKKVKKLVDEGEDIRVETAKGESPYELALKAIEFLK